MGRKAGISQSDIVEAASVIADRDGLEAASLSAVAAVLGIKTPSLYNHVAGLAGLRRALALHAAAEMESAFRSAVDAAPTPEAGVRAMVHAYRAFVEEHPGLYASMLPAPSPHDDEELAAAMAAPVSVAGEALRRAGAAGDDIHLIRFIRATLHGFADLEARGGFGMPVAIDQSFDATVDRIVAMVLSTD